MDAELLHPGCGAAYAIGIPAPERWAEVGVIRLLGPGGGVERKPRVAIVELECDLAKSMDELCVTLKQIEDWLTKAAASSTIIPALALTEDERFILEHRAHPENAYGLAAFVCYDDYCDLVTNADEVVGVVKENYN
jgi:hypothetical protein